MSRDYRSKLPAKMYKAVEELVERNPGLYASIDDFVASAVRNEIRRARASLPEQGDINK